MPITTLSRGQRLKLTDILPDNQPFQLGLNCYGSNLTVDFVCFGLDAQGKLSDDRYMIFFNQPKSPCNGVSLISLPDNQGGFSIDLPQLPGTIHRLTIAAAIDGQGTMSQLTQGSLCVLKDRIELARQNFNGADYTAERVIILAELYRKDGVWRFALVGQGFNGGLDALVRHVGGIVFENKSPVPNKPQEPVVQPHREQLTKITLQKQGDSTPLILDKKGLSVIHVRLSWKTAVDLDLHAFYRTKSGEFGHVYFGDKGNLDRKPYISLDQDAGIGNTSGDNEENLHIKNIGYFSSVVIATNIFRFFGFLNSGDNFAQYDGRVILKTDAGHEIIVPLVSKVKGRWCIIAKIDNASGSEARVINVNQVQEGEPGHNVI
jgi:tellurite resistance protein TerA